MSAEYDFKLFPAGNTYNLEKMVAKGQSFSLGDHLNIFFISLKSLFKQASTEELNQCKLYQEIHEMTHAASKCIERAELYFSKKTGHDDQTRQSFLDENHKSFFKFSKKASQVLTHEGIEMNPSNINPVEGLTQAIFKRLGK